MPVRSSLLAVAASLLAAGAAPAAASAAYRNCPIKPRESQRFGTSYVTSLKVRGVTCARGKEVVRAFQRCRKAHGGVRGRCPRSASVLGFRCSERRGGIKTQFSGKVTCTHGSRRVVHTYTQIT